MLLASGNFTNDTVINFTIVKKLKIYNVKFCIQTIIFKCDSDLIIRRPLTLIKVIFVDLKMQI
jgi:hypothetical protein